MTSADDLRTTLALARQQVDEVVATKDELIRLSADLLETRTAEREAARAEVARLTQELADCQAQPTTPDPTPDPPSTLVQVGVFRGNQTRAAVDEHSAWQGRPNQWAVTFHGKGAAGPEKLGPVLAAHEGGDYRLNVRLALAGGWGTLEEVAAGQHDQRYRDAAKALRLYDRGNSVVSLGVEPNVKGWPWTAYGREDTYRKASERIIGVMAGEVPELEFSYDLLIGSTNIDWKRACPSVSLLRWVGVDGYDNSPVSTTGSVIGATPADPEDRWVHLLTRKVGFNEVFGWGEENGLNLACFEWGCLTRFDKYANLSGGDNPFYIRQMFELARERDVTLCYFEDDDGATGALHRLMGATSFPKAAAAYREEVQR